MKQTRLFLLIAFILMYASHGTMLLLLRSADFSLSHPVIGALAFIGGGSPTFAAVFVVYRRYSTEEQNGFWSSVLRFRVPVNHWLYALVLPAILTVLTGIAGRQTLGLPFVSAEDLMRFPLLLVSAVFLGGLEEWGWRGVLLSDLRGRLSLVTLSLLTGVLWAFWHLPLFFIDELAHSGYAFLPYLTSTVLLSVYMTVLVIRTKSILMAVVMHASTNAVSQLGFSFPMDHTAGAYLVSALLILAGVFWLTRLERQDDVTTPLFPDRP